MLSCFQFLIIIACGEHRFYMWPWRSLYPFSPSKSKWWRRKARTHRLCKMNLWCRSKSLPDHSLHWTGYKHEHPWQLRLSPQGSAPWGTERWCGQRGRGLVISVFPLAGTSACGCSSANSQSFWRAQGSGLWWICHQQRWPQGRWLCCGVGPNPPARTLQSLGCFLPFISILCTQARAKPFFRSVSHLTPAQLFEKTFWCLYSSSLPSSRVCKSETRLNFLLFSCLGGHFRQTHLLGDISWPQLENMGRV